jgi:hypothetical protein
MGSFASGSEGIAIYNHLRPQRKLQKNRQKNAKTSLTYYNNPLICEKKDMAVADAGEAIGADGLGDLDAQLQDLGNLDQKGPSLSRKC